MRILVIEDVRRLAYEGLDAAAKINVNPYLMLIAADSPGDRSVGSVSVPTLPAEALPLPRAGAPRRLPHRRDGGPRLEESTVWDEKPPIPSPPG
jgi:hypothetical protein